MVLACSTDISVTRAGMLSFPDAGDTYQANMDCQWNLNAPLGKVIINNHHHHNHNAFLLNNNLINQIK